MPQQQTIGALGLQTSPDELAVPPGALVKAQNCVFLGPGVIGSRRGQKSIGYALASNGNAGFIYDDTLIVHSGTSTLSRNTGSAFTAYSGSYTPPDADVLRMKALVANDNLYFTTDAGVYRLDGLERTPALAGGPIPFDLSSGAVNATTSGFLGTEKTVAYRVVWGLYDANETLILGPPSGRWSVTNSSTTNTYNVDVAFPIPSTVTTSMFWRLYRTAQFPSSAGAGDEMELVYEAYFTSAQIAAGEVTYTDTTPDRFRGTPLYTNEGMEGVGLANDPPPIAKDICGWDQRAWYANTKQFQSFTLHMLGCGVGQDGITGVRLGDALVFGDAAGTWGETYVAGTTPGTVSSGVYEYTLTTGSTATENIENTARSLITSINGNSTHIRATYLSANGDAPGIIYIEALDVNDGEFECILRSYPNTIAAGSMSRLANVVTVDTSLFGGHGLAVGDSVYISYSFITGSDATFPAVQKTVASVVDANTFTVAWTEADGTTTKPYFVRRITPQPQLAWSPPPPPALFTIAAGGLVRTGGTTVTVTLTTGTTAYLGVGMYVPIDATAGTEDANFPAGTKLVDSITSDTVFTYLESGSDTASTVAYETGARVTSDPYNGIAGPEYVSFSKFQQPEAVPARKNFFPVGTPGKPILRIAPLGDNLFVFKAEGIYVISADAVSGFRVDLLDDTVHLYAPDSVCAVAGRLYALTNQGVVAVTNGGAQIVSGPIEQELFQYFGPTLADVKVDSFGVSRETDRLYELHLPALSGASSAPYNARRAYVYSTLSKAWTTWELARNWGVVKSSDDTYYAGGTTTAVYVERNTKTAQDYADGETTVNSTSGVVSATTLVVQSTTGVSVGDVIEDANGDLFVVTAVPSATTLTVSGAATSNAPTNATAWIDVSLSSGLTAGATINGTLVSVAVQAQPEDTAIALALAVEAAFPTAITASATPEGRVNMTAIGALAGSAGNAVTLVADGADTTVSGATFSGGADAPMTVYAAIPIELKWRSLVAGSPADEKQWQRLHAHFRQRSFYMGTFALTTDIVTTEQSIALYPAQTPDDSSPPAYTANTSLYPGMPVEPKQSRMDVPTEVARGSYLNVAWEIDEAFAVWWLNGLTLVFENVSPKGAQT